MRQARTQPKIRINLDMHEEVKAQLEDIRDRTNADSMGEVVRRAVALYGFLLQEKQKGSALRMRNPDGSEVELVFVELQTRTAL